MKATKIYYDGMKLFVTHKDTTEEMEAVIIISNKYNRIEALGVSEINMIKDLIVFYGESDLDFINKVEDDPNQSIFLKELALEDLKKGTSRLWSEIQGNFRICYPFRTNQFDPINSAIFIRYLCTKQESTKIGILKGIIQALFLSHDVDLTLSNFKALDEHQLSELSRELFAHMKIKRLTINNNLYRKKYFAPKRVFRSSQP
ncbi:hypothetical protein [Paenibacillus daejeonensis]|uniref:hypothetical protein n=1 Tax=Paenibacillus daejeonensis TaxID=135193 RepID=UPI00036051E2|nr:hypothetical protein [Paenibacillus daejeonensis]